MNKNIYTYKDMAEMRRQAYNEGFERGIKVVLTFIITVSILIALFWLACAMTVGI